MRMMVFVIYLLQNNMLYAQRYTGYGRGLGGNDDWDFSPGFKLLFIGSLIGICLIGGLIGYLKEKIDDKRNNKTAIAPNIPLTTKQDKENNNNQDHIDPMQPQKEISEHIYSSSDNDSTINSTNNSMWSLLQFAKEFGPKMQVGNFTNRETGKEFSSCIFTKPDGTRTFVAFSSALGELTPVQIVEMKNELRVMQLESGNYVLFKN